MFLYKIMLLLQDMSLRASYKVFKISPDTTILISWFRLRVASRNFPCFTQNLLYLRIHSLSANRDASLFFRFFGAIQFIIFDLKEENYRLQFFALSLHLYWKYFSDEFLWYQWIIAKIMDNKNIVVLWHLWNSSFTTRILS